MKCITPREDCVGNLAWGWFYILQFYFCGIFSMLLLEGKSIFLILHGESYRHWIRLKKLILSPKITNYLLFVNHSSHILIMTLPCPHQINFIPIIFISSTLVLTPWGRGGKYELQLSSKSSGLFSSHFQPHALYPLFQSTLESQFLFR